MPKDPRRRRSTPAPTPYSTRSSHGDVLYKNRRYRQLPALIKRVDLAGHKSEYEVICQAGSYVLKGAEIVTWGAVTNVLSSEPKRGHGGVQPFSAHGGPPLRVPFGTAGEHNLLIPVMSLQAYRAQPAGSTTIGAVATCAMTEEEANALLVISRRGVDKEWRISLEAKRNTYFDVDTPLRYKYREGAAKEFKAAALFAEKKAAAIQAALDTGKYNCTRYCKTCDEAHTQRENFAHMHLGVGV